MPHRRSHRKSHNGCSQCKKRRVKCDETLPICSQCARRETPCSFQVVLTGQSHPESGNSTPTFASTGVVNESLPEYQQERKLELKLFHHYSTSTYLYKSQSPENQHMQQILIPNLSLSHSYLFHSILAMSALHLHFLEPSQGAASRFWLQTALCYQQRVLVGLSTALSNITSENVQAAAITSMNVIALAIGIPGAISRADDNGNSSDPVGEVLSLRNCIQGVQFILLTSEAQLRKGELATYFHDFYSNVRYNQGLPEEPKSSSPEDDHPPIDPQLYKSLTQALERLQTTISAYNSENHASLLAATTQLLDPIKNRFSRELSTDIIGWPMRLQPDYFTLLGKEDLLSRVILLYFGVALYLVRDWFWFLKGSGSRLVHHLADGFSENEATQWREVIDFAREAVGERSARN